MVRMGMKTKAAYCIPTKIYYYAYNPSSVIHTRKFSLSYEEMSRECMKDILGDKIYQFRQSWNKFQFRMIENLIVNKIAVSGGIGS